MLDLVKRSFLLHDTGNKEATERTTLAPKNSLYRQLISPITETRSDEIPPTSDTTREPYYPRLRHLSCYMSTMSLWMSCKSSRHNTPHATRSISTPELRSGADMVVSKPLMRKDIFYSANPLTLYECQSPTGIVSPGQSSYACSEVPDVNGNGGNAFDAIRLLLNFAVLKEFKFIVFAVSSVLWTST